MVVQGCSPRTGLFTIQGNVVFYFLCNTNLIDQFCGYTDMASLTTEQHACLGGCPLDSCASSSTLAS